MIISRRMHLLVHFLRSDHFSHVHQVLHPMLGKNTLALLLLDHQHHRCPLPRPATHVLHAVADRLLVYVQSDIVHSRHRGASVVVL